MAAITEYLTFEASSPHVAFSFNDPGCCVCSDYSGFYDQAPVVGADRPIPGSPGRLYVAREDDELDVSLQLEVSGITAFDGSSWSNARTGVRGNLRYLRTHLLAVRSLRPVTFHYFDTTTAAGNVVVIPPAQVALGTVSARMVLHLLVPASALT